MNRTSPRRIFGVLAVAVLLVGCGRNEAPKAAALPSAAADKTVIAPQRLKEHLAVLSADAMEGRGPGTPGAAKARDYIIATLKTLGVGPGPEGWIQKVPLRRITNTERKLSVRGQGVDRAFEVGDHFVTENARGAGDWKGSGEIVYCGHGVQAPEYGWDDFKGLDCKGKVLLVFVGDPVTEDRSLFAGDAMTYYGRWTYKLEKARELGALGCLIIHRPDWAGYGWLVCQTSWNGNRMDVRQADYSKEMLAAGWISYGAAEVLVKHTGKSLDELAASAAKKDFKPIPLGIDAELSIKTASEDVDDENIVGVLPGLDPAQKDDWVIYTAHFDHLGKNEEVKGADKIFNGAIDNGSGCAGLLGIAEAFANARASLKRSVMFLFVCSEEQGLLGSRWYSEHPLVSPARTVANINIDGLNVLEPTVDLQVVGSGQNDLEGRLAAIVGRDGRTVAPDSEPEKGYYYRSDHFNFARIGIPALYVKAGDTVAGKPSGYMTAWKETYRQVHYHQPSDQYDAGWPLTGGAADALALYRVGFELAVSDARPAWSKTSEFRAVREASLK